MLLVGFFFFLFQTIRQLRFAGTVVSFQSHIFHMMRKTEPHDEDTYWGGNNQICYLLNILYGQLLLKFLNQAAGQRAMLLTQSSQAGEPSPFYPLNQSVFGRPTVHKTIG
jgi:hypothetical protein